MQNTKILNNLTPSQGGIIHSIDITDTSLRRRFTDMGLTPGAKVTVKRIAPFGDPIVLSVRGYELSLRRAEAAKIRLKDSPVPRFERNSSRQYYATKAPTAYRLHGTPNPPTSAHLSKPEIKVALIGNPNSGKTTLFNALTGSNQYVGNWPGVTVEKKEGKANLGNQPLTIVDLPGIYSLSPYSMEEIIARDYIIKENPDVIINIVDATNLERNLYLTLQLLELEHPMVLAVNFMDELEKKGDKIDCTFLSEKLGIPVVPISARNEDNLDELLNSACSQIHITAREPYDLYDGKTREAHHKIESLIRERVSTLGLPLHWVPKKVLEGDKVLIEALHLNDETSKVLNKIITDYENSSDFGDLETELANMRYGYIEKITKSALTSSLKSNSTSISDKIDRILTHKLLAIPIFLAAMLLVFSITFGPFGKLLSDSMAWFINKNLGLWVRQFMTAAGVAPWLIRLCVEGIIAGVGGVLTFLPQISLLFLFLSVLEDCGYMARGAFIMDRLLKHLGLSGKAFIPMIMGFGCSVPAIMATRTMEREKDRRMTIMLIPFMSCSAKLPVYGLISAAFFGSSAAIVVFALYVFGLIMAVVSGLIFKNTLFKGETANFIMELPPYRLPVLGNTLRHVWTKIKGFIVRAGTLILLMSVILWLLQNFDINLKPVENPANSILGFFGGHMAPIFNPMGYGTWQAAVALLTGLVAKEAVVASLSMFYGFSPASSSTVVAAALSGTFQSPLSALSFLVFILLYVPCIAAISAAYRETSSLKWTLILAGWQISVAYICSLLVYQLGKFIGLG